MALNSFNTLILDSDALNPASTESNLALIAFSIKACSQMVFQNINALIHLLLPEPACAKDAEDEGRK